MSREREIVEDHIEVVSGTGIGSEDVSDSNSGSDEESGAFKSSLGSILSSIVDWSKTPSRDDFMYDIGFWCVRNKVPHQWVDKLLPILNKYLPFEVPLTIRTILKVPTNLSPPIPMGNGHYCHFSLLESLLALSNEELEELMRLDELLFDFASDGVEINKQPKSTGYPILVRIVGTRISPIIVG